MRKLTTYLLLFVFAVGALGVMSACDNGNPSGEGNDTIVIMSGLRTFVLNPLTGGQDRTMMHAMFDTLVGHDRDGNIVPQLAYRWEYSEDGMQIYFFLRQDVLFHDGTQLTADDVVYSYYMRAQDPRGAGFRSYFTTVDKVDDFTVVIQRATPFANALAFIAGWGWIVPRHLHEPDPYAFNEQPVGSGPFRFIEIGSTGNAYFERFDDYFLYTPYFRYVVFRPNIDMSTAIIAMETGEIDFITSSVLQSHVELIERNPDLVVTTSPSSWSIEVMYMQGELLNNDLYLRRAIFYAVNRENALIFGNEGIGTVATELFPRQTMAQYANTVLPGVHDVERARYYLERSNYNGETIIFTIFTNAEKAQSIQADLRLVGINAEINMVDISAFSAMARGEGFELTLTTIGISAFTVEHLLRFFRSEDASVGIHKSPSPEYDALVEMFMTVTDAQERGVMVIQAMEMLRDRYVFIPLFDTTFSFAHRAEIVYDSPFAGALGLFYVGRMRGR